MLTLLFLLAGGTALAAGGGAIAAAAGKLEVEKDTNIFGYDVSLEMNEEKPFKLKFERAD